MPGLNDELVRALMGSGSPQEMDDLQRYKAMLGRYPGMGPMGPPTLTGDSLPPGTVENLLAAPDMGQGGAQAPSPNVPLPGQPPPQAAPQGGFLNDLRNMGTGLQILYGRRPPMR